MGLIKRLKLCWAILRTHPGNMYAHAERELPPPKGDEMQEWMNQHLLELVHVFSTQGHSGFSAAYAIGALTRLLKFEPLRPLTGEESEWNEVSNNLWQNNRCGRVFRDELGAYDIDGKVFREPDGATYTSKESRVRVEFPYWPKTEIVDVPEST